MELADLCNNTRFSFEKMFMTVQYSSNENIIKKPTKKNSCYATTAAHLREKLIN